MKTFETDIVNEKLSVIFHFPKLCLLNIIIFSEIYVKFLPVVHIKNKLLQNVLFRIY